jgi:hypothetical protein
MITSVWGNRVRLAGGRLVHWAGSDQDGSTYLAHDAFAWTEDLRPAGGDAPECVRCVRRLPGLENAIRRAREEDLSSCRIREKAS